VRSRRAGILSDVEAGAADATGDLTRLLLEGGSADRVDTAALTETEDES
jgi:hypothetical protein